MSSWVYMVCVASMLQHFVYIGFNVFAENIVQTETDSPNQSFGLLVQHIARMAGAPVYTSVQLQQETLISCVQHSAQCTPA